jgi:hypothetical protein
MPKQHPPLALIPFFLLSNYKGVCMAIKTQKGKGNEIKPVRATVVEDPADWKKMWQVALAPPTEAQVTQMKRLRPCFGS